MAVAVCRHLALAAVVGLGGLAASCGGDEGGGAAARTTLPPPSQPPAGPANACPQDGCRARIVSARRAGDELELRFEANYAPDLSRNHVHVFWDTWTARQVSDDAEPRFGVTQGDWVPTGDNPFTTTDAASVRVRGQSTRICVTSSDRDHNVIDPDLVDCRDVSGLL